MFGRISTGQLRDRADVLAREEKIVAQRLTGIEETVVARGIPCSMHATVSSRVLTLLGARQATTLVAHFEPEPRLKTGYVVRVLVGAVQYRYVVKTVKLVPAPHDPDFQVALLTREVVHAQA